MLYRSAIFFRMAGVRPLHHLLLALVAIITEVMPPARPR